MKINHKMLNIAVSFIFCTLYAFPAHSLLMVTWSLDSPIQTVGTNDVVSIDATITNDNASDEIIDLESSINGVRFAFGSLVPPYSFDFGFSGDFFPQFTGISLNPGQSFNFIFGELTPDPAPVPIGTYNTNFLSIDIYGVGIDIQPEGNGNFQVTVIPEPITLALMCIGIVGLGFRTYKRPV